MKSSGTNLSIYFVIGSPPNEYFDSSRIGSYFPLSNSLLLSSISNIYFDLPKKNIKIFGVGQKKDYMLLQHTNNKAYYQLGNNNDEFFIVSANQNIKFKLYSNIGDLFVALYDKISKSHTNNILIILQDHGSLYQFNGYPYIKLLYTISEAEKNFFIYDDSCQSGSIIDLFEKNNKLFTFFQEKNKMGVIATLYHFAAFHSFMLKAFKDSLSIFFPQFIIFLSIIPENSNLFEYSFYKIINEIIRSYQNQGQEQLEYFSTPINYDFFDKLKNDTKFDISSYICQNRSGKYKDLNSFLLFLKKNYIKNLANLMMIKSYFEYTCDNYSVHQFGIFSKDNYKLYLEVEKVAFEFPNKENAKIEELSKYYSQITDFFKQYKEENLFFFHFKSKLEIITSTSVDKTSLSYLTISVNSITKVIPNTSAFAYFIRIAFFKYNNQPFDFINFQNHIFFDQTKNEEILFPSCDYTKFQKTSNTVRLFLLPPNHLTYPNEEKSDFSFQPSVNLPKKIASVRFLTHFVKEYFSHIKNPEYFPKLNFSCGYSEIPSNLLINFISLSILPSSDSFPSDLKLNNELFFNVLKFTNSIFQTNSIVTSINDRPNQLSINKDRFEFTIFFSAVLSSKIRSIFAKNLLLILSNPSNLNKYIYLFSTVELECAQKFLKSKHLEKCTDSSNESIKQFLSELFSENFIKEYYSIKPSNEKEKNSEEFKKLRTLKKKSEFNLQKMFLDLESSILNILPSDVFVFSIIYSYLLFEYSRNKNFDQNHQIQTDIQKINQNLSILFGETKMERIIDKIKAFNNLTDILQFCNNYIFKSLQKTFDFLQYFYQTYYYLSFCKISNQYDTMPLLFENFLKIIPNNSGQEFFNLLTDKLKPFPLFCLPFIFFEKNSYASYKDYISTFISTKKNFPDSISLFESNYFYSEQFRIHLSNLSLYSELKKSVIENINILNSFLNVGYKEIFDLMSHSFFQNSFSTSESFEFKCQTSTDNKSIIDFCDNSNLKTHMKQSISSFIKEFISKTNQFFQFDLEEIIKLDNISLSDINDFQLFFCQNEENNVYIDSILNNLTDIIHILSISKSKPTLTIFINEDIIHLAYSILETRFNNKVEIQPIVELIPKYEAKFSNERDWSDPSNSEFMALCSAVPFTLSPTNKFRKRFFKKKKDEEEGSKKKDEENKDEKKKGGEEGVEVDDYYSSSNSPSISPIKKIGNYRNEFGNNDNDINNAQPPPIQEPVYKKLVDEALNMSEIEIHNIQKKYNIRIKKWKEIIWSIFYDFFNKKLNEINLNFDINNNYYKEFSGINCFKYEDSIIKNYFPQLFTLEDLQDKEIWIGRFMALHKNYKSEIKSAYLYAIISSYAFLKNFYTFENF